MCFQNSRHRGDDEKGRKRLKAASADERPKRQTVTKGVCGELSWASKPVTGAVLIEAAF